MDRLGLRDHDPFTIVAINALDEDDLAVPDAAAVLNWAGRFRGTEARDRRGLRNPDDWNDLLRPDLGRTQRTLRRLGAHRILITGSMRLPAWFTVGVAFQETSGFTPAKIKDGRLWTKPHYPIAPAPIATSNPNANFPYGRDLALAIAISADLTIDVKNYLASAGMDIPVMTVHLPTGISNASLTGPEHAYAVALAVRDLARELNRTVKPPTLHLFLATPAAFALILGGLWDRVPATQTYEDLSSDGYEPAFTIPN